MMTRAPSFAKRSLIARPMPELPPVTIATLFVHSAICFTPLPLRRDAPAAWMSVPAAVALETAALSCFFFIVSFHAKNQKYVFVILCKLLVITLPPRGRNTPSRHRSQASADAIKQKKAGETALDVCTSAQTRCPFPDSFSHDRIGFDRTHPIPGIHDRLPKPFLVHYPITADPCLSIPERDIGHHTIDRF